MVADAKVEERADAVFFRCGICDADWEMEIPIGEFKLIACPKCQNASLQQLRGV